VVVPLLPQRAQSQPGKAVFVWLAVCGPPGMRFCCGGVVGSPPMSGRTSPAGSTFGSRSKRLVKGRVNGSVTTLVDWSDRELTICEGYNAVSIRMTYNFRLGSPLYLARGVWRRPDCGQLKRRFLRVPHSQHKAGGLGTSSLGLKGPWVGSVGLVRARTATFSTSPAWLSCGLPLLPEGIQ